jgi:hypothetical protein
LKIALTLCKGAAPPEWVVERLRQWAELVADTTEDQGNEIDRLLFKSAMHLQRLSPLYTARVYEMIDKEYPDCIDTLDQMTLAPDRQASPTTTRTAKSKTNEKQRRVKPSVPVLGFRGKPRRNNAERTKRKHCECR